MNKRHRKQIENNMDELILVTKKIDNVLEGLLTSNVLNEYMIKHLNKYHELKRRHKEFYQMMLGRGPTAFDHLISVLRETENFQAELLLCGNKVMAYEVPSPEPEFPPPVDELDRPPKEVNVDLVVRKHPDGKFMDSDQEYGPNGAYRMRSKPRGQALIINIVKTEGFKDRLGSDVDLCKLEKLFNELGFRVISKENLTAIEIMAEVAMRKADHDLAKADCFVVFIMCHGRQKGKDERSAVELLATCGKPIDTNWLTKEFQTDPTFTSLKGKPKLFFFQACREVMKDENKCSGTTRWIHTNIETDSELMSGARNYVDDKDERDYEDTVLGFSTIPGYLSMRHPNTGTWFVDAFCEVIAENAWHDDLNELWRKVDLKIRKMKCEIGYQTPELVIRGFKKKLYFNPHLAAKQVGEQN